VRILMPAGDWVANGFEGKVNAGDPAPEMTWDPGPKDMDKKTYEVYFAFVNYYIHQVNLLRHLLGEPYEPTYAEPSQVLFVGRSKSGVACTIEMSPYTTTVDWQEQVLVCFEHGWVKVDLPAPLASYRPGRVEIYKDPGGVTPLRISPTLPFVHAMRQQAKNFLAAVKGEMPPLTMADEALEDLLVARKYVRLLTGK